MDYDASLARVGTLLDAAGDQDLLFIEEMFPEDVEGYRRLRSDTDF